MRTPPTSRYVRIACLVSGLLIVIACAPPSALLQRSDLVVQQPLDQPLEPNSRLRVRTVGHTSLAASSASKASTPELSPGPVSGSAAWPALEAALVEAVAMREGLLFEVVGWRELQAYRAHLDDQAATNRSGDWEFKQARPGFEYPADLPALIGATAWSSCRYEVVAEVAGYKVAPMSIAGPSGRALNVPGEEATVRMVLRDLADDRVLMDLATPVHGEAIFTKAATIFAGELERQWWAARDGGRSEARVREDVH